MATMPNMEVWEGFVMILGIMNQKGGVGKTTSTMNLGWGLITKKKKVLMIDFDPQNSLTIAMDLAQELTQNTIYDVLNGLDIKKAMLTDNKYFYFIPANINLAGAEIDLLGKQNTLYDVLQPVRDTFDYILIDCPPALGNLSINALCASDRVIIPMACDYLAWKGYELLLGTLDSARKINPELDIMGILPTMYFNTIHSKEVLELIQETGKAFKTVITHSVKYKDATVNGEPIMDYDRKLGKQYLDLAKEVIERAKESRG
jgi:chromosome partitioning protein